MWYRSNEPPRRLIVNTYRKDKRPSEQATTADPPVEVGTVGPSPA